MIKPLALILLIFSIVISCDSDEHEISTIPKIEFKSLEYIDGNRVDTFKLKILFQDGDFDLGFGFAEIDSPFHAYTYYFMDNDIIKSTYDQNTPNLIKIGASDTLPEFSCNFYNIVDKDTVYAKPNPFHYNIFVDFYLKENGQLSEFDFREFLSCSSGYNSRFPEISSARNTNNPVSEGPFNIIINSSTSGELTYNMTAVSPLFQALLDGGPVKLKVKISDRSLNLSNEIETDEIVF